VTEPLRVGLIGCGVISGVYLQNSLAAPHPHIVACADVDHERARACAREYGIDALSPEALLADPAVECVLDLTPPSAHFDIGLAAVRAGKHVYQEKPLAAGLEEGRRLLREAEAAGVRVGCAPDTFLGAGLQTVRRILDTGGIGEPVGAELAMLSGGPERWHPDPAFFYALGGGPLFDVGPYPVTAAATLLGPVVRVCGTGRRLSAKRVVVTGPRSGDTVPVHVDTTTCALLEHRAGTLTTVWTSFDVPARPQFPFALHGTSASVVGPDPNAFDGPVIVRRRDGESREPLVSGRVDNARGIGLDDMASAIAEGRPHRASGALGLHVLEVLHAVASSARTGRVVAVETAPERPEPLPVAERSEGGE
jgi:predicted dehydrogenase